MHLSSIIYSIFNVILTGIDRLLSEEVFSAAFPLHDGHFRPEKHDTEDEVCYALFSLIATHYFYISYNLLSLLKVFNDYKFYQ